MDSKDLSLDILTKLKGDGLSREKSYTEEALKVLNKEPIRTAWGWDHGRPIYNRLPMIAEAYQKSYNSDQAMVYLDPTVLVATGPGTLEVIKNQRNWEVLTVQSGVITWEGGEQIVQKLQVDVTGLDDGRGLQDGVYQVGYKLYERSTAPETKYPGYELAFVQGGSLADIQLAFDSSGETAEHKAAYALSNLPGQSWWPNDYYGADGYLVGTHYTLDFLEPTETTEFVLNAESDKVGANCALYVSDNAIIWKKRDQVIPDSTGWTIDAQGDPERYYRFFFWDGKVSIGNISYTGFGEFRDRRVFFPETTAEPYIDDMYNAIEGDYILLATFTVKNRVIDKVDDKRRVTYEKYQPVADWLTKFGDEQLRCRFDDVVRYSDLFMNPVTADYHFYEEMDDSDCNGLGEITLGSVTEVPKVDYPTEVEVLDSVIAPYTVDHIVEPTQAGDLVTPTYAEYKLNDWSMDNGIY